MPGEIKAVLLLVHLASMLFMAAPLYALIMTGERMRVNLPPGYNTDRFLENGLKGQPLRCYGYLTIILVSGLLLMGNSGWPWSNWALLAKLGVVVLIVLLLSYVHFYIQPRIEKVFEGLKAGEEVPAKDRPTLVFWRTRRRKLSAVCLFLVLSALLLGVKVTWPYSPWLLIIFLVGAALFAYRAYRKLVPLGWV